MILYNEFSQVLFELHYSINAFSSIRTIPHWTIPHRITLTQIIHHQENYRLRQVPTRTTSHLDHSPLGQLPTKTGEELSW